MLVPINGYYLIRVDPEGESVNVGGTDFEVSTKENREQRSESIAIRGTVVAADDITSYGIKVGAKVLVRKWEAQQTFIGGEAHVLVKPEDILMVDNDDA